MRFFFLGVKILLTSHINIGNFIMTVVAEILMDVLISN